MNFEIALSTNDNDEKVEFKTPNNKLGIISRGHKRQSKKSLLVGKRKCPISHSLKQKFKS